MQAGMTASTLLPWGAIAVTAFVLLRIVTAIRSPIEGALRRKGLAPPGAFAGKTVWITGASQGLGAEVAAAFGKLGARLILSARRPDPLKAVADRCRQEGGPDHHVVPFDLLGSSSELEVAAAEALRVSDGAIDFLVHNAGEGLLARTPNMGGYVWTAFLPTQSRPWSVSRCSQQSAAEDTSSDVATHMLHLNTLAPIALTRAALPAMLQRGKGRIVVVSSMAALIPSPGQALYAAAKSGLNAYFHSLATEVCNRGVSVTVVCPGPIAAPPGASRSVMGASGLQVAPQDASSASKRVGCEEAASWIAAAAYHGVREARVSKQPIMLLSTIMRYSPSVATMILHKVGPRRVAAMKAGGSAYDVTALLRDGHK